VASVYSLEQQNDRRAQITLYLRNGAISSDTEWPLP